MNEADIKIKQQIVDKIKSSTNILVTVGRDPSVDDLSATIGLAALLNKLGKHATAIFSGAIPPAITFLDPNKIFESTADSLRDFIIALDKEKADHLRYKVEGDVVKIFITPYHTNITSEDLEFSQGDYNIELVLALGVVNQENLDTALTAHGNILQDVTVATFSAGGEVSQVGGLSWNDKDASSLSEMVTAISDAFKTDKQPILDKQISTALLTGIVAATDRFSNTRTTPQVMTIAAQLMAAGADQQLIAAKLQESHEINTLTSSPMDVKPPEAPVVPPVPVEPVVEQSTLPPDNLVISHEEPDVATIPESTETSLPQPEPVSFVATSTLPPDDIIRDNTGAMPMETAVEPSLGGTLNATADQAAEDARRELESQQNKTILSHSYLGDPDSGSNAPINSIGQPEDNKVVDIFSNGTASGMASSAEPTIGAMPVIQPPKLDMPLPPPLPDFSTLPPPSVAGFDVSAPAPAADLDTNPPRPEPAVNDPTQFRIPGQ